MQQTSQSVCDGCGALVPAVHVRERIQRLEWATRFRPLHIQTLLLAAAPPVALTDFFYAVTGEPRSDNAQSFFHSILQASGITLEGKKQEEVLGEFQRHGVFLAYLRECPESVPPDVCARLSLRIRFSYRPKFLAPLDSQSQAALDSMKPGELGDTQVVVFSGEELPQLPSLDDCARFATSLRQRLQAGTG